MSPFRTGFLRRENFIKDTPALIIYNKKAIIIYTIIE
jgi:hypothetical protein